MVVVYCKLCLLFVWIAISPKDGRSIFLKLPRSTRLHGVNPTQWYLEVVYAISDVIFGIICFHKDIVLFCLTMT
jgi:hypothetical protein